MKVLYIERNLTKNSLVYDQIERISKYAEVQILAVHVGSHPKMHSAILHNVFCPYIPTIESIRGWCFKYTVRSKFLALNNKYDFDLIHSHFTYPEGIAACDLHRKYNIPFVITGRGSDILLYPQQNSYLSRTIRTTLKYCSGFIAVSNNLRDKAIELGVEPERSIFQPNGIPIGIFRWSPQSERLRLSNQILYAGSLTPTKNVVSMLDAFFIARKKNSELRLRIAGVGPLEHKVRQRISELKIDEYCQLLGNLNHKELALEMQTSTILLLASRSEGWPNVVMEAMACGTPVVGSNVGGIPEQIVNDSYGLLCDHDSPEDIASQITMALKKNWDNSKIALHGRQYDRDTTALRIVELYRRIKNDRHDNRKGVLTK